MNSSGNIYICRNSANSQDRQQLDKKKNNTIATGMANTLLHYKLKTIKDSIFLNKL